MITVKELYHHGIPGMHWGDRRFQNYDGSLTDEGRKRYGVGDAVKKVAKAGKEMSERRKTKKEEKRVRDRAAFLRTASADEIERYMKKHKGDITMDELQTLTTRFRYEKSISERASAERNAKSKWSKLDKFTTSMKQINDFWEQGNRSLDNVSKTADAVGKIAKLTGHKDEAEKLEKAGKILEKAASVSKTAKGATDKVSDSAGKEESEPEVKVSEVKEAARVVEEAVRSYAGASSKSSAPADTSNRYSEYVNRGREKSLVRSAKSETSKSNSPSITELMEDRMGTKNVKVSDLKKSSINTKSTEKLSPYYRNSTFRNATHPDSYYTKTWAKKDSTRKEKTSKRVTSATRGRMNRKEKRK